MDDNDKSRRCAGELARFASGLKGNLAVIYGSGGLATIDNKTLTTAQLDGLACVVCGADNLPLVPIPGVETATGSRLFRCPNCKVDVFVERLRLGVGEPVA